jgi:hypothetical protein
MSSNLPKTCFRIKEFQKITRTRGADKYEHIPKEDVEMKQTCMKHRSQNSLKAMLKTDANKSKNNQNITPKSIPKDDFISGVAPPGAPLVAQTGFGHQKLAHSAPKVLPMIEKSTKNDIKEPPDWEKELPNSSFFGTWSSGLREALTIRVSEQRQHTKQNADRARLLLMFPSDTKSRHSIHDRYKAEAGSDTLNLNEVRACAIAQTQQSSRT